MDEKLRLKAARRQMNQVGWSMLLYMIMMNAVVIVVMVADLFLYCIKEMILTNGNMDMDAYWQYCMESMVSNGWGYIITILIGTGILFLWKKPRYVKNIIFQKEKKMTFPAFVQLLAVFLSAQAILQLMFPVMEWLLNQIGLSSMAAMEAASMQFTSFSMLLYAGILGPISEEILCRGLALRLLQPYGKRFAIVLSALLFGLFHGNVVQIPFAFLVGLVLGYVTVEYSILWAIILHVINNLVLGEGMMLLYEFLPPMTVDILFYAILGVSLVASVILIIVKRKDVAAYYRQNKITFFSVEAAASSVPMWLFIAAMLLLGFVSITPLYV